MIQTKAFGISKNEYFGIDLQLNIRSTWWLFLLIVLVTAYAFFDFKDPVSKFMFFFGILYFPIYLLSIYRTSHSNANKLILSQRVLTITPIKITAQFGGTSVLDTPTISEVPTDCITKTVVLEKHWILYISKASFIVIPKSVFYSAEDVENFKMIFFKNSTKTEVAK